MKAIDHPEKIGIGTWDKDSLGTALNDVDQAGFNWYYNWTGRELWDVDLTADRTSFVAMVRDPQDLTIAALNVLKASGARTLLGFNEPDNADQADMSVGQAIGLWYKLEATGMRLGSPVPSQHETLGENSWLGRFMEGAKEDGLRVDFIQLHYYSDDKDVGAFKEWLEAAYEQYKKPIWVTEWGLADWDHPNRFSVGEQAAFAEAGSQMMDDLSFVKKHAWFAAYDGGGGWDLNSGLFNENGSLTKVGKVFTELTDPPASNNDREGSHGTARNDRIQGTADGETLTGLAGNDHLSGRGGDDRLVGGMGGDVLEGNAGADTFDFNSLKESTPGAGRDVVYFSHAQGDEINLRGIDAESHQAGNQAFHWADASHLGAKFNGEAGELRFSGGVLMGDANGDGMADFHVSIVGHLSRSDVIL